MKRLKCRPAKKQITGLFVVCAAIFANTLIDFAPQLSGPLLLIACTVIGFDFVLSRYGRELTFSLEANHNWALFKTQVIKLVIENQSERAIEFDVTLHHSGTLVLTPALQTVNLNGHEKALTSFEMRPEQRGDAAIFGYEVRILSPFGLWQTNWLHSQVSDLKVYPDFSQITSSQHLNGVSNRPIDGLKLKKKRGQGIEFHQLREYRLGDSLRQIDWQATSKRRKLISREYQEEENQHVVVMLDASKKMNIEAEQGNHFDYALNGLLMLSHTVLKQGDWFSMQSFNHESRWLASVKGAQNVSRVMNHFYDLYPDQSCVDYSVAVNQLLAKRSKRSLVMLVTTLDEQSLDELLPALKLLQKYHLVAVINITNRALDETLEQPIEVFEDANQYCAALSLLTAHQANMKRLRKEGIIALDCKPEHLQPYVINTYLNVKHSGAL